MTTTISKHWTLSEALYKPRPNSDLRSRAVKDPSLVRYQGRWHLFTTVRDRRQNLPYIEYAAFSDWATADQAPRYQLPLHSHLYCAPQVFFYQPLQTWFLIYQAVYPERTKKLQPVYSCNKDINDPAGWSMPQPFFKTGPDVGRWIDFWVMGDGHRMYLFYTGCSGYMGMSTCSYQNFPNGFGPCATVLEEKHQDWMLFEASHIYKIKNKPWYIAVVEGLSSHRYFQLYVTQNLNGGAWQSVQIAPDDAFVHASQVEQIQHWTDHISHGECLRADIDERLEIEDDDFSMLIQGVGHHDYLQSYIGIPWSLGLLHGDFGGSLSAWIEDRLSQ
jgi:endo-1,4-beta-xylanase